jgi:hypothetical protein
MEQAASRATGPPVLVTPRAAMQRGRGGGGGWGRVVGLDMGRVLLGRARSLMRGLVIFLIATPACGYGYTGERS